MFAIADHGDDLPDSCIYDSVRNANEVSPPTGLEPLSVWCYFPATLLMGP